MTQSCARQSVMIFGFDRKRAWPLRRECPKRLPPGCRPAHESQPLKLPATVGTTSAMLDPYRTQPTQADDGGHQIIAHFIARSEAWNYEVLEINGRSGRIRTCDPCVPNVNSGRKVQQKQWYLRTLDPIYPDLFTGFLWSICGWEFSNSTSGRRAVATAW